MTSLSKQLRTGAPARRSPMPEQPIVLRRAARSIARRWPHTESEQPQSDPKGLLEDLKRRRRSGDWENFCWADLDRAARALIDHGYWRFVPFEPLLGFLLHQVQSGVNRPFVRTLFRKYLESFDPTSQLTRELAAALRDHWRETGLPVGEFVDRFRIFDDNPVPAIVAFMANEDDPHGALRQLGVEAPRGPGMMADVHSAFVNSLQRGIAGGDLDATRRLLSWLDPAGEVSPLQGDPAERAINTLLEPWAHQAPRQEQQELIETRLLAAYGDPRSQSTGVWTLVSSEALQVICGWLAGETIQVFFDIVTEANKSHMWQDRREFWTGLFDNGYIAQAWFALSEDGINAANRIQQEHDRLKLAYARNDSTQSPDRKKCLLIMNAKGHWVVEGSHSFPIWVFPAGNTDTLIPYAESYTCEQFRELQFTGQAERIVHLGDWQSKVLTAIMP
ncbi:MAG: EH signature domain-containing protein [Rhodobacteraceae bacterium]|nr:EH signature domain-containing protein [Paracoccaceae bacterium]